MSYYVLYHTNQTKANMIIIDVTRRDARELVGCSTPKEMVLTHYSRKSKCSHVWIELN